MKSRLALIFLLSLTASGAVMPASAQSACLLTPEAVRSGGALPNGLWVLAPAKTGSGPGVEIACEDGRVAGVTMRLVPGQLGRVDLFLTGQSAPRATFFSDEGMPSEWSRMEIRTPDSGGTVITLKIETPDSVQAGPVYSGQARLGDDRSGVTIPVTVELIEDAPLFRDTFDVDPVIGQFSQVW